jgi:hypothetical protein
VTSDYFRLADAVVRIDWQDEALRGALGRALVHRSTAAGAAALHLEVTVGRTDWPADEGLRFDEGATGLTVVDAARRIAVRVDLTGSQAQFECAGVGDLPVAEQGAPFRLIFQRWLATRRAQMLHAGAVGLPGGGAVLLAAHGGGGKSNTVLACLVGSGLQLLGEDFLAVDGAEHPRVWSLYSTAKLHAADVGGFPGLAADFAVPAAGSEKALLTLGRRHQTRFADGMTLCGILVLQVTGRRDSRLVPTPPADAVKEMLTSLLMVVPSARRGLFEFTTRLAGRLPVHRLELGTDLRQPPRIIQDFLEARA